MNKDTTYRAPIGSVDLPAFDDDGSAYEVHPCHDCLPWHAEVVVADDRDVILVREWHAVGCESFQRLISRDDADD